jgi:hypothetical protein
MPETTDDDYQRRREAEFGALYAVRLAAEAFLSPASSPEMRRWRREQLAKAVAAAKALDPTETADAA